MKKAITIVGVSALLLAACASEGAQPVETAPAPVQTAPPAPVTAPRNTVAVPTTPPTTPAPVAPQVSGQGWDVSDLGGPIPMTECADVDLEEVSVLIPNDWDAWCGGFKMAGFIWLGFDEADHEQTCAEFWSEEDEALLRRFMQDDGLTHDVSIALIDFFWTVC